MWAIANNASIISADEDWFKHLAYLQFSIFLKSLSYVKKD